MNGEIIVTFNDLIKIAIIIMSIWGFVKVIMEIAKAITSRHDREQKWDEMANSISEERKVFGARYDEKLAEMERKIDENHADTESKLQQIRAEQEQSREEQYKHTTVLLAILDGLQQLNCNGKVTEAKRDLEEYITRQAYGVK